MESLIRLFRAIPIKTKQKGKVNKTILKETIKNGFIFSEEIFGNFNEGELLRLVQRVKEEIGISAKEINNAFHKSWKKIATATDEQLFIEQIVHYITTYGFEALGIYSNETVYIPTEKLLIPQINVEKMKLIVVKGYTKEEIKEKLITLLATGIALKEDTLKDVTDVALYVELNEGEIQAIKNKEVKTALYDYLGLVPQQPVEFLRYLIYKATETTLIIKNKKLIKQIKEKQNLAVTGLLVKYKQKYGLEPLASIFLRFKPLFLAFRNNRQSKTIINKIRKLAVKNHRPMPKDYLNDVTTMIKQGKNVAESVVLESELDKVNIWRKIRLAYALKFRTKDVDSIIYKVRNGKGYAKEFSFDNKEQAKETLKKVIKSIAKDVKPQVEGKKIYIPRTINYTLPATEKQFTGFLPSGSYISIPNDMVFGVHWENLVGHRVDLDLSVLNADEKYGWNSNYRSEGRGLLFSGDVTDAQRPNGATELFYLGRSEPSTYVVMLNYFNFDEDLLVPFKIIVAKELVKDFRKNYVVNPNNVLITAEAKIDKKQKMLGLVTIEKDECRFYFLEINIGGSITSSNSKVTEHSRKYLMAYYKNTITLNDVLIKAGAILVENKEGCNIDLSPEMLEKDTIIKLLQP